MPKLIAMHYSHVGHPSARLDGVTVPYFDEVTKEPVDTIIWLRNGGGKTSQIQLKFSLFVPDRNEFIGKVKGGSTRTLEQYFQPNETGLVVSEWDLGPNISTRVVGQAVRLKPDGDIDRLFFSFIVPRDGSGIGVENLPMRQFQSETNPGYAKDISSFLRTLNTMFQSRPELDLFTTRVQREWLSELRKWGFNPDLYRMLLRLNVSGGKGDSMLSRIDSTEKMIGLVSDLLIDAEGLTDLQQTISKHRDKLRLMPELLREQELFKNLKLILDGLVAPGQEYIDSDLALTKAISERVNVASRVHATKPFLETRIVELEAQKADLSDERNKICRKIDVSNGNVSWLEYWSAVKALELAVASRDAADLDATAAENDYKLLQAMQVEAKIRNLKDVCTGLLKSVQDASAPAERQFIVLNSIGVVLDNLLSEKLAAIDGRINNLGTELDWCNRAQKDNAIAIQDNLTLIASNNVKLSVISEWMEGAKREKELHVRNGHFVRETESSAEATSRLNWQMNGFVSELGELNMAQKRDTAAKEQLGIELGQNAAALDGHRRSLEVVQEQVNRFKAELANASQIDAISDLLEDDGYSPYIYGLENQVETVIDDFRRQNEASNTDLRRLSEAIEYAARNNGLLPPQEDVVKVVEALRAANIPAVPYVEYLDEDKIEVEDARKLLVNNPARYGGVYVTSPRLLEKAQETLATLPFLRGPVQISLHSNKRDWVAEKGSHTVLPESNATFNRLAAEQERGNLVRENEKILDNIKTVDEAIKRLEFSLKLIGKFLYRYPDGTEENLNSQLDDLQRKIGSCEEIGESLQGRINYLSNQLQVREGEVLALNRQVDGLRRSLLIVEQYERSYERVLKEKAEELVLIREEIEGAEEQRKILASEKVRLNGEADILSKAIFKEKDVSRRINEMSEEVVYKDSNKAGETIGGTIEELVPRYREAKKHYDEKTKDVEPIRRELEVNEKNLRSLREEFAEHFIDLNLDEISELSQKRAQAVRSEDIIRAENRRDAAKQSLWKARENANYAEEFAKEKEDDVTGQEPEPVEPEKLEPTRAKLIDVIDTLEGEVEDLEFKLDEIDSLIKKGTQDLKGLGSLLKTTSSACDGLILSVAPFKSLDECREMWDSASLNYNTKNRERREKSDVVDELKRRIDDLFSLERYKGISENLKRRIVENREVLHSEAAQFGMETSERLATIQSTLETTGEHKMAIVNYLHDYAETTRTNLDYLQKVSVIPHNNESWAKWSDVPFFKVSISQKKLKEGYCKTNIERYVDKLLEASDDNIPTDATVIARTAAIEGLCGITKITTLKPTNLMLPDPCYLSEVGNFSDGEKLEFTLLAYMMIARLVSGASGASTASGNIMIVDNPIGECSLSAFVELQRMVARVLGVQLIYPTALNDFSILSMFPHIVGLKNERVDRRTRFQHIEVEKISKNAAVPSGILGITRAATLDIAENAIKVKAEDDHLAAS